MTINILTILPEMFAPLQSSIIGRAVKDGSITINIINIRDFSDKKHHNTDDYPFGGGAGMVMMPQPIANAVEAVDKNHTARRIYMSPKGRTFKQDVVLEYAKYDRILLLCGHYEGVDQRVLDLYIDEELSLGDFVLTGGEIPACIVVDAVSRLIDGVLSDSECYEKESISSGMLEYPQYTRPYEFHGVKVPDVLISGHHANIDKWREESAKELTEFLQKWFNPRYALNMDGGGSTTMYIKGSGESLTDVVNYPTDNKRYDHYGQRRVSTHFLVKRKK